MSFVCLLRFAVLLCLRLHYFCGEAAYFYDPSDLRFLIAYGSIGKLQRPLRVKQTMTQVVISARLIALFLGCLLVGQSVLPLAAFAASEMRALSQVSEASDILGVRSNVERILELQAAGSQPNEELLWNKAIVLKQLLLGYLEVRQTSDLLDEAIDDTYDAIDKQVRNVNRRVEFANIANFTTFGVLFNIAAADRLKRQFNGSNELTFVSASDLIDNQLSQEYTAKGAVLAARDRGIQYNNILNFTQSGILGVVSQGLVLNGKNNQANTLDLISGSTLLLLSSAALIQARIGRRPSKPELNVLAHVLAPGASSKETIPSSVLQYLNSPATENGLTRRESLIERWRKSGVITTNLKSERNLGKLSATANTSRRERVQLITDRIVMLHDVKTTIESMDKQLVSALKEERRGASMDN